MAFFDGGAAASTGGAGAGLWLNEQHYFSTILGCGPNTNTRAELLALWALLYFAKDIGLPYLHVFGDFFVIINWAKGVSTLDMVNLEAWCYNTKTLIFSFTYVDFSHVYREYNKRADTLSKAWLNLTLSEICEGESLEDVRIQLF